MTRKLEFSPERFIRGLSIIFHRRFRGIMDILFIGIVVFVWFYISKMLILVWFLFKFASSRLEFFLDACLYGLDSSREGYYF